MGELPQEVATRAAGAAMIAPILCIGIPLCDTPTVGIFTLPVYYCCDASQPALATLEF
jgi:hypothetical protein